MPQKERLFTNRMLFRLTLSWLLCVQMGMGAVGVWIAMVADWICRTTFFVIRWLSGAWKEKCGLAEG